MKKRLLIVDALNNFLRCYVVNPSLSNNGLPLGGTIGFLNTLQSFIREIIPDKIIICWDGERGSCRRKQHNKEYKSGRKPLKLNWDSSRIGGEDSVLENKIYQMTKLYELLELLPITQFMLDSVEADDIIAYVCQMNQFVDYQKVIVSSDKDFIQLLDPNTILYRPIQKEILNTKKVVEEYEIHPTNFLLARAMCGDKSDNLKGVDGVGLPSVAKRFPMLKEQKQYFIPDIMKVCENEIEHKTKVKLYNNVLSSRQKIEDNYGMMQLCIPKIPLNDTYYIQEEIRNKELIFQKTQFITLMNKIGFSINIDIFTQNANRLVFKKE